MISILYWQVFDNTPAALDGTLAAGDEITGVNSKTVKGKTKVEVAKMIQAVQVLYLQWCSDVHISIAASIGLHQLSLFVFRVKSQFTIINFKLIQSKGSLLILVGSPAVLFAKTFFFTMCHSKLSYTIDYCVCSIHKCWRRWSIDL